MRHLTQLVQTGWDADEDELKTDASDEVPLDAETAEVLRVWRERPDGERDDWGPRWTGTGQVFTT